MSKSLIIEWVFRVLLAVLYLMMALPKFTGDEMTVHIFTVIGVEPWGRMVTGVIELAVFVLVLIPATTLYGVILSLGTILGALLAHFTVLGVVVQNDSGSINDGGQIFMTAIIILILTLVNLFLHREKLRSLLRRPEAA